MRSTSLLTLAFTLLAASNPARAQCPPDLITSPFAAPGDLFGESCALDGDLLLVGGSQSGVAAGYGIVLRLEGATWVFEDQLQPVASTFGQGFGFHVDLDGSCAVVSAPCTSAPCTSSVEFFERSFDAMGSPFWERTAQHAIDVRRESGNRVALSGDKAVVTRGSAEDLVVFERSGNTWIETEVIAPPGGHSGTFGASIELDDDVLLVSGGGRTYVYRDDGLGFFFDEELFDGNGSPLEGAVGLASAFPIAYAAVATDAGVHLFSELAQPFPMPPIWVEADFAPAPVSPFGFRTLALAPPGTPFEPLRVAVGDRLANDDQGVIWVFEQQGSLALRQKIVQPNTRFFGFDVVLDGSRLATGTWTSDLTGQNSISAFGSAWVFELSTGACPLSCTNPRLPDQGALAGEERGKAVALLGDLAFVGAIGDDTVAANAGAVHVYRRFGACWALEETLVASDGAGGDAFGYSLSLDVSRTKLLVGAPGADGVEVDSGSAYLFEDLGGGLWVETALLRPATEVLGGGFGSAVAIDPFHAVVGQPGPPGSLDDQACVFQDLAGNWVTVATLFPTVAGGGFGRAVDIVDLNLVVAAPADGDAGLEAGAVYHFTGSPFGTWFFSQKLLAPDGSSADAFGTSVALELFPGTLRLVVGAPGATDAGLEDAGRAYVYESGLGLSLTATLGPQVPEAGARFASALALEGDLLVVGAPHDTPLRGGRAHALDLSVPTSPLALGSVGSGGTSGDSAFGAAVAIDAQEVLVGAPADDASTGSAWSRLLFDFSLTPGFWSDGSSSLIPATR